ncbi:DeoR/GlpR family DNA-binding transcription regulator [Oribacterium sp. WCC10]|uniref:DeoR/GlpR family DNA-binding transcription regulator n=1 Tax=Oribacterium sp. WCC10 TaxID=1855343 RepID=UPI0008E6F4F5|nr:DeoR/GlpR family DNA-binding transcription regulator [Oribacterium sp. WCC10]SFG67058.1 transcriptional regulator, DeoR family [Oribacterium sp. WCC10]
MLAEERFARILSLVDSAGTATIAELMDELNVSESTIKRDLSLLDKDGLLKRVRGGATSLKGSLFTHDDSVSNRMALNVDAKQKVGELAASLIEDDDFVYIDAGTTTARMLPYLTNRNSMYVTNSLPHAMQLSGKGFRVSILGGEFKNLTEAIVGEEAIESLQKYNFTKGFFGTNGVSIDKGFTTPEIKEAMVKRTAMRQCRTSYVLCDKSKFDNVASITFGTFESATVITDYATKKYKDKKNVMEV